MPEISSVPHVSSASRRIAQDITAIEDVVKQRHAAIADAVATEALLDTDIQGNRESVEQTSSREVWYSEFQTFTETLADFLDAKVRLDHMCFSAK
mgnify:CR=1 FL=1